MNPAKKIRFVVNPISGTRTKESIIKLIPKYIDQTKMSYDIVYTERSGHAAQLAAQAAEEGIDVVVAVGGDGTVNEVARALVHKQTALGIIPCGSGNGLARHLYIPINPIGALKIIAECNIELLDYGKINGQPFFCTCGIGFDAFISKKFAEAGKRGLMTYVDNTLKVGLTYKPEKYRISIDGEEHAYEAFLVACANASQYGNNAYIAPAASMSDGLMDVTILEPFNLIEAPQVVVQLFNKTIDRNSHVRTFQCRKLHISREAPGVAHFDGDPMDCDKEIDVELVPKGIHIVVNDKPKFVNLPLLSAFTDIYNNMSIEVERLRDDLQSNLEQTNKRIRSLNAEILARLRE